MRRPDAQNLPEDEEVALRMAEAGVFRDQCLRWNRCPWLEEAAIEREVEELIEAVTGRPFAFVGALRERPEKRRGEPVLPGPLTPLQSSPAFWRAAYADAEPYQG